MQDQWCLSPEHQTPEISDNLAPNNTIFASFTLPSDPKNLDVRSSCADMRLNTSGKQAYRSDLFERTADRLERSTKTGGIEAACIHARNDIENKQEQ